MKSWIGVALAFALIAGCSQKTAPGTQATEVAPAISDLSGTYVAQGRDLSSGDIFVEALRLTQSGPGQLTGTLEGNEVSKTGKRSSTTQNVTGSFDGAHATLAFDELLGHTNRSATLAPGLITLSWVKDGQLVSEQFRAQSEDNYAATLRQLGVTANTLVAQKQASDQATAEDHQAIELASRLEQFLDKEATWTIDPVEARRKKALAYGDAGLARVKQLLAMHQSMADVQASNVAVQMNTGQIQLDLALDGITRDVMAARQKMEALDRDVEASPCLAKGGNLSKGARTACKSLPLLVARYHQVHDQAASLLTEVSKITAATRADYGSRLKEAEHLVDAAR